MDLTRRQKEILSFIQKEIEEKGISPSVREICGHFGLKSTSGVHRILKALERKGYLASAPGKKRSWRPTRLPGGLYKKRLPVLGQIAAGLPIDAQEEVLEELPVDSGLFGQGGCFGLYVKGDSMTGLHIKDGDIAIIRPSRDVEDGEVAAVMVEGMISEATLKIVRKKEGRVELHAANPLYEPLVFEGADAEGVLILGRLVGLIRRGI